MDTTTIRYGALRRSRGTGLLGMTSNAGDGIRRQDAVDSRKRRKRTRPPVETEDYLKLLKRLIRRGGERVGDADEVELAVLVSLTAELEGAIRVAVEGQRSRGVSWAGIARGTGTTRQAAQQRWGRTSTAVAA